MRRTLTSSVLLALTLAVLLAPRLAEPDSNARAATNFKQEQRLNSLVLQYAVDAFAPNNRFGSAITGGAMRSSTQSSLDTGIANGANSLLLRMLNLNDLTGTNEPSVVVGVVNGSPDLPPGNPATYNGASDLDWWYGQNLSEINVNAIPKAQLTGSIVSKALSVGPGSMLLNITLIGPLALSSARIAATVGGISQPLTSSNGFPPGHLPSEQIDPLLQSFTSMSSGKLAGDIRASSLASAPIPASLVGTGITNCNQGYIASNTWLDLLVGGCPTFFGTQVAATQPDHSDPAAPAAGAGAPYVFTRTGNSVTGCRDKNGTVVSFPTCLSAAAYSAYFQFTSDRVIVPGPASVGGIAEQPDLTVLPASARSSAHNRTIYVVGAAIALALGAAGVASWRRRRFGLS